MTRISMQGALTLKENEEWKQFYAVIIGYTLGYYEHKADLMTRKRPVKVIPLNSGDIKEIADERDEPKCRFTVQYEQTVYEWSSLTAVEQQRWIQALSKSHKNASKAEKSTDAVIQTFGIYKTPKEFQKALTDEIEDPISNSASEQSETASSEISNENNTKLGMRKSSDIRRERNARMQNSQRNSQSLSSKSGALSVDPNSHEADELIRKEFKDFDLIYPTKQNDKKLFKTNSINSESVNGNNNDNIVQHSNGVSEITELRSGRLYYSYEFQSKLVFAQLFKDKMLQFVDEECLEQIGTIDLSIIKSAKLVDKQTFELYESNVKKVHLFTIYDTSADSADLWTDALFRGCSLKNADEITDDDDDKVLSDDEYNVNNNVGSDTDELLAGKVQDRRNRSFFKRCMSCIFGQQP